MALIKTAEQEALRDVMRSFLDKHSDETKVRQESDSTLGYDPDVWRRLAEQIGVQALAIPEEFDGAGYGFDELSIVMEETGRALFTGPVLATVVLAANAILLSGDNEACKRYLPEIASGALIATVAISEKKAAWVLEDITTTATSRGDGNWVLNGVKPHVLEATGANLIVVAATTEAGVSLFLVDSDATGLQIKDLDTMDRTRRYGAVAFADTPAVLLGEEGAGWPVIDKVFDLGLAALASEQVGAAAKVLDSTVEYLCVREQFGRPIGSFQAIKHRCADMLVELESARSAAAYASMVVAAGSDDVQTATSIAKAYCSQAFYHIAAESIQMHGGIGFTWEHPAHLYFKRAKTSEQMLGSPSFHRERIAELIGMIGDSAE
ncbi:MULTISPECIES: acyl-CoA dehydrogenase family protein [Actinomycetes]|uniref:acyl-CoA dehydrogenase family protein n=1 Tax=Actinomycetes TaxID=1760 RepID=UPI0004C2298F|nr:MULTISPECIES: acyl-CoA dehydrogenase family protein [Actinomycetes]